MAVFTINSVVRLEVTFRNAANALTDPSTIELQYQDPTGNETTKTFASAELTKSSTGIYYFDLTVDEAGIWFYRYESSGVPKASAESTFDVSVSQF